MLCCWQVPCVTRGYVVDWVSQPWLTLDAHILFKGHIIGQLQQAQDARGVSPEDAPEPSMDWGAE